MRVHRRPRKEEPPTTQPNRDHMRPSCLDILERVIAVDPLRSTCFVGDSTSSCRSLRFTTLSDSTDGKGRTGQPASTECRQQTWEAVCKAIMFTAASWDGNNLLLPILCPIRHFQLRFVPRASTDLCYVPRSRGQSQGQRKGAPPNFHRVSANRPYDGMEQVSAWLHQNWLRQAVRSIVDAR